MLGISGVFSSAKIIIVHASCLAVIVLRTIYVRSHFGPSRELEASKVCDYVL